MDRPHAMAAAAYIRVGATVIEVESGKEETFQGPCVSSFQSYRELEVDGKKYKKVVYRRKVDVQPSISLAKKACRGKKNVVCMDDLGGARNWAAFLGRQRRGS